MLNKISLLLEELTKHPFIGTGKPEQLKHILTGCWSRRINREHRLVYEVVDNVIRYFLPKVIISSFTKFIILFPVHHLFSRPYSMVNSDSLNQNNQIIKKHSSGFTNISNLSLVVNKSCFGIFRAYIKFFT
ncbi:MAG: Txe/YoeB family addiction module toxin [Saprospiraceae bacterium]|nr:Txe/YoeB family addiction module toxin [Saprospiraceae bacterium]